MKKIEKIIVARTDKIGDLVLSIPSFFMIRKMFPDAEITILVRNYNYEIVSHLPYIDRVVKIDDYQKEDFLKKIQYIKADTFIALYNDKYVMQLVKASGARIKIGPLSKIKSFFIYNKGVIQNRSRSKKNEAEYNLDLVKKLDHKKYEKVFERENKIYYDEIHKKAVQIFLDNNKIKSQFLIINPFIGGSAKTITDDQYTEIINKIMEKLPELDIVLTCHITQEERGQKIIDSLSKRDRIKLYANGGDLLNLVALIDRCDVYLGGSTGPTHIAGALNKKIVAIYPAKKTQSPIRWGVFSAENVTYIIPDKNRKENYKHKFFINYTDNTRDEIVKSIVKMLKLKNKGTKKL